MSNFKKEILDEVLSHPLYKSSAEKLDPEQRARVVEQLQKFIESFSHSIISSFSKLPIKQNSQENTSNKVIKDE